MPKTESLDEIVERFNRERVASETRLFNEIHTLLVNTRDSTGWGRPLIRKIAREAIRTWER